MQLRTPCLCLCLCLCGEGGRAGIRSVGTAACVSRPSQVYLATSRVRSLSISVVVSAVVSCWS